jgi:hypothetical protein
MKLHDFYFLGDKTEEAKMGGACGTYVGEEKFIFGCNTKS